ncbi:uncharacterized protein VTP21DRAFT_3591 [Calcarisporiella thermophila]|uniref:uncharacterized protein n=1 Tax=Calcarisporiella thermophila TaxID=911321 RepID=UPI003743BC7F
MPTPQPRRAPLTPKYTSVNIATAFAQAAASGQLPTLQHTSPFTSTSAQTQPHRRSHLFSSQKMTPLQMRKDASTTPPSSRLNSKYFLRDFSPGAVRLDYNISLDESQASSRRRRSWSMGGGGYSDSEGEEEEEEGEDGIEREGDEGYDDYVEGESFLDDELDFIGDEDDIHDLSSAAGSSHGGGKGRVEYDEDGNLVLVRKVPVWRPVQRWIGWLLMLGVKIGLMAFWIVRELARSLGKIEWRALRDRLVKLRLWRGWLVMLGVALVAWLFMNEGDLAKEVKRGGGGEEMDPPPPRVVMDEGVSAEVVFKRMEALERAVQQLHTLATSHPDVQELQQQAEVLSKRLADLHSHVQHLEPLSESLRLTDQRLAAAQEELNAYGKQISGVAQDARSVRRGLEGMQQELGSLRKHVDHAVSAQAITQRVVSSLAEHLPSRVPVRRGAGGRIEIAPEFWRVLKNVLVSHDQMNARLSQLRIALSPSQPNDKPGEREVVLPSWDEFLARNRHQLTSLVQRLVVPEVDVVGRDEFLQVLGEEMEALRREIDSKLKSEDSPYSSVAGGEGDVDVMRLVSRMIDEALQRYSADVIARPDYALYSGGGRVIHSLTSKTYTARPTHLLGKLAAQWWGIGVVQGLPPAIALHPDTSVGKCWPFEGAEGQLGVLLSRRIVVTEITLEHVSRLVALDLRSAPRRVEVWGVFNAGSLEDAEGEGEDGGEARAPEKGPAQKRLLAEFEYDINAKSPIQTFSVPVHLQREENAVHTLLVRIRSNWGHSRYTCLYRVRVHGREIKAD